MVPALCCYHKLKVNIEINPMLQNCARARSIIMLIGYPIEEFQLVSNKSNDIESIRILNWNAQITIQKRTGKRCIEYNHHEIDNNLHVRVIKCNRSTRPVPYHPIPIKRGNEWLSNDKHKISNLIEVNQFNKYPTNCIIWWKLPLQWHDWYGHELIGDWTVWICKRTLKSNI